MANTNANGLGFEQKRTKSLNLRAKQQYTVEKDIRIFIERSILTEPTLHVIPTAIVATKTVCMRICLSMQQTYTMLYTLLFLYDVVVVKCSP